MFIDLTEKICMKCEESRPLTAFRKDDKCKDGHRNSCKVCRKLDPRIEPSTVTVTTTATAAPSVTTTLVPYFQTVLEQDLPDPERLPAAYLKRCSDYWTDLVGGEEPARRIL